MIIRAKESTYYYERNDDGDDDGCGDENNE